VKLSLPIFKAVLLSTCKNFVLSPVNPTAPPVVASKVPINENALGTARKKSAKKNPR
jgi:hypothetical protein